MKCDVAVLIMCLLFLFGGTCTGINTVTHTHTAVAESAGWSQSTLPGVHSGAVQIQSTFTAVLGEDNMVSQSNTAGAYGSGALQIQDNAAVVEGSRNSVAIIPFIFVASYGIELFPTVQSQNLLDHF